MNSPPSIIHNLKRTNSCKHSKIKVAQKYVPVINESANLAVKHFEECESQVEYSYFSPPIPLSRYLHQMIDLH